MLTNKDYTQRTIEELVSEEKKMKSGKVTTALFIGLLVGIAVYSATHKGFILPIILLIAAFAIGYRESENRKNLQAEINRRG